MSISQYSKHCSPRYSAKARTVPQLAAAAGYQRVLRRHGKRGGQHRAGLVGIRKLILFKRDGPLDAQLGVGKVLEGVILLQVDGPAGVRQISAAMPPSSVWKLLPTPRGP